MAGCPFFAPGLVQSNDQVHPGHMFPVRFVAGRARSSGCGAKRNQHRSSLTGCGRARWLDCGRGSGAALKREHRRGAV